MLELNILLHVPTWNAGTCRDFRGSDSAFPVVPQIDTLHPHLLIAATTITENSPPYRSEPQTAKVFDIFCGEGRPVMQSLEPMVRILLHHVVDVFVSEQIEPQILLYCIANLA